MGGKTSAGRARMLVVLLAALAAACSKGTAASGDAGTAASGDAGSVRDGGGFGDAGNSDWRQLLLPKRQPLRIAAGSDLELAFRHLAVQFELKGGVHVDLSFGATGLLAKQISDGTSFDVFAANVSHVDDVVRSGACFGDTKALYAKGHIVLWTKSPSTLPKDISTLKDPKYKTIAIANPDHSSYGRAAREAMTKSGIWADVQQRVVFGENVQQAMTMVKSGQADVSLIAMSLVANMPGTYALVDEGLHEALDQALVICKSKSGGPRNLDAHAFLNFMDSDDGRAIMRQYGFLLSADRRDR